MTAEVARWAWAEIDLDAVAHNVGVLRAAASPAAVWAVVKADGYGHGAVAVSRAALDAGCAGLCVALTTEGVALRQAGIDAPILILSEQPADHAADDRRPPPDTHRDDDRGGRGAGDDRGPGRRGPRQGGHGHAPRRRRAGGRRRRGRRSRASRAAPSPGGHLHPPRRRRRTGQPVHRRATCPARRGDRRAGAARRRRHPCRQLGRGPRSPGRPTILRPRRHRRLRRVAGPGSRPAGDGAAPRALAARQGVVRQAARRGLPAVVRPASPARPSTPMSPPCRWATPTVCAAACRRTATC